MSDPDFVGEVQAFLRRTGMSKRTFGEYVINDPKFAEKRLLGNLKPSTMAKVRAWMAAHPNGVETAVKTPRRRRSVIAPESYMVRPNSRPAMRVATLAATVARRNEDDPPALCGPAPSPSVMHECAPATMAEIVAAAKADRVPVANLLAELVQIGWRIRKGGAL